MYVGLQKEWWKKFDTNNAYFLQLDLLHNPESDSKTSNYFLLWYGICCMFESRDIMSRSNDKSFDFLWFNYCQNNLKNIIDLKQNKKENGHGCNKNTNNADWSSNNASFTVTQIAQTQQTRQTEMTIKEQFKLYLKKYLVAQIYRTSIFGERFNSLDDEDLNINISIRNNIMEQLFNNNEMLLDELLEYCIQDIENSFLFDVSMNNGVQYYIIKRLSHVLHCALNDENTKDLSSIELSNS